MTPVKVRLKVRQAVRPVVSVDAAEQEGSGETSMDRAPDGRRIIAAALSGALTVYRYDDADPEVVESSLALASDGVTSVSLQILRHGECQLFCCRDGAVQVWRSTNLGETWTVVATGLSGYKEVKHSLHEASGTYVLALWAGNQWWACSAEVGDDGLPANPTTPVAIATGKRGGDLKRRRDGTPELSYPDASYVIQVVRCARIDGSGSWA